ncbi:MAG: 3-methylornithyl-N6-L-lysine dehydrogenase PylD [Clostridiales bacterium]|nr:3-methylornithyl-N6-L-lysine dehydrogenase PylD [Clostridiales bacterium]
MSRLLPSDVIPILTGMEEYDRLFQSQTGKTMFELAAMSVGMENACREAAKERVAVVPVTSGLGLISHFADSVCGILRYYGLDAFVTETTDVTGLYEAYGKGADMVFMADDDTYSAVSLRCHAISDNGYATGIGFAQALYLAMEEKNEPVLVLGAGPVGRSAAVFLIEKGCHVFLYDQNTEKAVAAGEKLKRQVETRFATEESHKEHFGFVVHAESEEQEGVRGKLTVLQGLPVYHDFHYLYDATTSEGFLTEQDVGPDTVVAAPGMPCGITGEARQIATVIHNPLELGTLTMYFDCKRQEQSENQAMI